MGPLYIGSWRECSLAKPGLGQRRIDVAVHPATTTGGYRCCQAHRCSTTQMPAALQAWLNRGAKAAAIAHHPNGALALLASPQRVSDLAVK
jgi:hypothetical protein